MLFILFEWFWEIIIVFIFFNKNFKIIKWIIININRKLIIINKIIIIINKLIIIINKWYVKINRLNLKIN